MRTRGFTRHRSLEIHYQIPESVELRRSERLGKEVGHIGSGGYIGHREHTILDQFAHIEVATFYMLDSLVVFRALAPVLSVATEVGEGETNPRSSRNRRR